MKTVRRIELLAPAKNIEIGQQAILHGADAVYIGAPRFGARSTAGNSIADLTRLIDFAHRFDARVYITLNTILRDDEQKKVTSILSDNPLDAEILSTVWMIADDQQREQINENFKHIKGTIYTL